MQLYRHSVCAFPSMCHLKRIEQWFALACMGMCVGKIVVCVCACVRGVCVWRYVKRNVCFIVCLCRFAESNYIQMIFHSRSMRIDNSLYLLCTKCVRYYFFFSSVGLVQQSDCSFNVYYSLGIRLAVALFS